MHPYVIGWILVNITGSVLNENLDILQVFLHWILSTYPKRAFHPF